MMVLLFSLNAVLVFYKVTDTLTVHLFLGVPNANNEEIKSMMSHLRVTGGVCYLFCASLSTE